MGTQSNGTHRWRFYRAGGVNQVLLEDASDVLSLPQLDPKLWVALSCPVKGLEFDERTLAMLDTDKDGRVRVPELLDVIGWLKAVLKEPEGLMRGQDGVPLAVINPDTAKGKAVLGAAQHMLEGLGKNGTQVITVAEAMQTAELFSKARLNGDGVVAPVHVNDPDARAVAESIVALFGGVEDRSGMRGVDALQVERFFTEAQAFDTWRAMGEAMAKDVMPAGEATAAADAAVRTVDAKVEDFFLRGRLAAFDPRAQAAVNHTEAAYLEAAAHDLSISAEEVRRFPLAHVEADEPLPLTARINPAWQVEIDALREQAVEPLLGKGRDTLTEADWRTLKGRLAAHRAWVAQKAGAKVESLGAARVRTIVRGGTRALLEKAIQEDLSVAPYVEALAQVERLARCWRDLVRLLNNFVSFSDFYARRKAVFQAGTLYLDGRSIDLCVQVNDPAKHGQLAGKSAAYVVYVDCTRPSGEKMSVACAITAGDSDNLFVGRNGLFYDRRGRDWDASITKIVDNPISVRQAFLLPYKKLLRWIEDTVAKRAAAADEAANARLQAGAAAAAAAGGEAVPAAPPPPRPKFDVGTIAALGVAVGGITAALGALLGAFFGLGMYMPLGFLGLIVLISGPSMIIAWLKLRRRNLGPILDANGWAVNTLTRVNIPLGRSLTDVATLPVGTIRSLRDPFAPARHVGRWTLLFLALVVFVLWKTGLVSRVLSFVPPPENVWFQSDCDVPETPDCTPPTPPAPEKPVEPAKPEK